MENLNRANQFYMTRHVCNYDIEAIVTMMTTDIHILLIGGCLPHTGSVSIYEDGTLVGNIQLPEHKDGIVGDKWARVISELRHNRVTVVCGIHYEHATSSMIKEIVDITNMMLEEVMENLRY